MLSSLKKWVQDVAVDLTPLPPPSSSFSSTHHYFYSNEQQESRKSSSSAVCLSRPISLDSMGSSKTNIFSIPPPLSSPVEVDLSHLNREEQEHIANVLRRARAVEEQQQQSNLPSVNVPSRVSPSASISSSLSSSSTSTSSCFASEHIKNYDNEIPIEAEKSVTPPELILTTIRYCQTCTREHKENTTICLQCQENKSIDREIENNNTFLDQQLISINKSLSDNNQDEEEKEEEKYDKIYDNIMTIDQNKEIEFDIKENNFENQNQSIIYDISRTNHLTEIDENDFFYHEPSPYESTIISNSIDEQIIPSYKIDEVIDDDDHDERDHVKELEETIANLTRHFPSEDIQNNSSSNIPIKTIDTDSIFEMEIESPSADEVSFHHFPAPPPPPPPTHPLSLSISVPIPINNPRASLSRSSGIKENLTDLLIPATPKTHPPLQRTLSTHSKRMLLINRHKRNLPSVPNNTSLNRLQLRRANSESRFSLPAVPLNLDDENDLLEIDLNNPMDSINRTLRSKPETELKINTDNNQLKVKEIRDQTTNTPPISILNSSIKLKKTLKKKHSSPTTNINDQISSSSSSTITKLQKSTSTEITYPFPITKLILNPSRHDLGFRITGGHSNPNCIEVTACIQNINKNHRNYQILQNVVQEGDEVLELGGVSLRGKSALFVENLINTIQNEFEIIIRNQSVNSNVTTDNNNNIPRRHSVDISTTQVTNNAVIKSKSISICSLNQLDKIADEEKSSKTEMLTFNDESSNIFSHRQRTSLLPNDRGIDSTGNHINIDRQNSNESDESDSLSQYFHSRKDSLTTTRDSSISHDRNQNVIPIANQSIRLQSFLKSDSKRATRGSTNIERKSSLSFASLKFLKKKTKSVDFSTQHNVIMNQLRQLDYVGDIELQIGHDSEREQLVVRIIRAKNLLPKDTNGFSDPFVKIYLLPGRDQENKRRIKHISKTLDPVWNQTVIYGHMHREEVQYKKLEITVWDFDRFKANDFLGQVTIDLKDPNAINDQPHWYRLQALRSREEITNRGSSPRLFKMTSVDSAASLSINKNSVNRVNQQK